jgi:hypothetical protein
MKTRDFEALEYVANSGYWRVTEDGDIETSRDVHGRPTDPAVWRSCTFPSPSKNSSTRKRIWVKGRRVYANRVVWRLTFGPIPEGYQVDHKDDNSLNDRPGNLQLLDSNGNLDKEANRDGTRVCRFQPVPYRSAEFFDIRDKLVKSMPATDSNGQINVELFPPDETPDLTRDKIDDAVEEIDWRISILYDLKVGLLRWWQAVRRWFDVTFLGFR